MLPHPCTTLCANADSVQESKLEKTPCAAFNADLRQNQVIYRQWGFLAWQWAIALTTATVRFVLGRSVLDLLLLERIHFLNCLFSSCNIIFLLPASMLECNDTSLSRSQVNALRLTQDQLNALRSMTVVGGATNTSAERLLLHLWSTFGLSYIALTDGEKDQAGLITFRQTQKTPSHQLMILSMAWSALLMRTLLRNILKQWLRHCS